MVTNRTPRQAQVKTKVTPRAVELFRQMQTLPSCTCCAPRVRRCQSCDMWWDLHRELNAELNLAPWEFPAVNLHRGLAYASDWDGARELIGELMERLRVAHPDEYLDLVARYQQALEPLAHTS
jgi:hypothetical protein